MAQRALEGLQQAWKLGARKVVLETDNMVVTRLLKAQQIGHDDSAFISEGHKKDDSVGLESGGNKVADALAAMAFSKSLGLHQFLRAPDEGTRLLQDDGNNIGTSKTIMI
ncbi:hypothetical protein PVK06_032307 [Gossypium arboreum]|uniref:RNase H type-1 domain-containing protein n=1 Tax=Gossypium arboreum TaxID=29729 RepID=A0ABR0NUL9_GOSAR|nr:hypothetical protein PVK06_032307 [Gossypium arboreum]